jgi:hypothetical protein
VAKVTTYKPISRLFMRSDSMSIYGTQQDFVLRGHPTNWKDAQTRDQVVSRNYLTIAKRTWSTLGEADKKKWKEYANENIRMNKKEQWHIGRGIDAFVRSSVVRQSAELDPMPALPAMYSPLEPRALDLLPGADARELVFRIEHAIDDPAGHVMLVRMTPTGVSPARSPYPNQLRHVRGVGKDSIIALPESGTVVRIPDTRFELVPAHKYAIEVRIARLTDGTLSLPYYQAGHRREESEEDVAAIASVRTYRKGEPASRPAVAARARRNVQKDPLTGQFVSSVAGDEFLTDPALTDNDKTQIEAMLADMLGKKPRALPKSASKILPAMLLSQEVTVPAAEPSQETMTTAAKLSDETAAETPKTSDETAGETLKPLSSPPQQAQLPPVPRGKVAIANAPGVTVDEDDVISHNLASSRGYKYFPSHYVRHRYFSKR